jgi:hypothetical protein
MGIDYEGFGFPKAQPRIVDRIQRKADLKAEEVACRKAVDLRDKRRCFYPRCKAVASEKHHIVSSSVRGQRRWRSDDIVSACAEHHRYFKAGLIRVEGNPDTGPVKVFLTKLGQDAGLHLKGGAA